MPGNIFQEHICDLKSFSALSQLEGFGSRCWCVSLQAFLTSADRTRTVFVPHAHWEAYGRGSLPLHHPVSDSANPHYVSDPLPQPSWDHRSTGQL